MPLMKSRWHRSPYIHCRLICILYVYQKSLITQHSGYMSDHLINIQVHHIYKTKFFYKKEEAHRGGTVPARGRRWRSTAVRTGMILIKTYKTYHNFSSNCL